MLCISLDTRSVQKHISLVSIKMYVVGTHWIDLSEAVIVSTRSIVAPDKKGYPHNIFFFFLFLQEIYVMGTRKKHLMGHF